MGSLSNRLKAFPFSRYRQVVILGNQMNNIRKKALPETTLITSHHYWLPVCQCGQIAGIVIGREIDINSLPGSLGQLNGRNHIAVCRNNNSHITVLLIGVCHNLRHNASICLFLFMRMDDIAAAETGNIQESTGTLDSPCLPERTHTGERFFRNHSSDAQRST